MDWGGEAWDPVAFVPSAPPADHEASEDESIDLSIAIEKGKEAGEAAEGEGACMVRNKRNTDYLMDNERQERDYKRHESNEE